ncbi:DMT family transporter [Dongia soli]|uniref:DMT family transporter n=1 Tax=Dongia soli TaxID=600628 RepID=A0ABU5EEV4_9PROT|nr:DMT family transporter [Dongia soli]MDY0884467.1 DMT family transporter [Dongia soli]
MSAFDAEPGLSAPAAAAPKRQKKQRSLSHTSGIVVLCLVTLLWGINWPITKIAVTEIPVWTFRAISLLVGGFGLLLLCVLRGASLRIARREIWPILLVTLFNVIAWQLCSAFGLFFLPSGRASILALTMPLWAALLSIPVLGEKLTVATTISLLLGLIALGAMVGPQFSEIMAHPIGIVLMLAAAISWALGTVLFKYYRWTSSTALLTGWQLVLGGLPVLIGALISDRSLDLRAVSSEAWLATAYTSTAAMIFCQWAWLRVVTMFPTAIAGLGIVAIPAVGVISGALLLGESVTGDVFISLSATMLALIVVFMKPKKQV